MSQSSMAVVVGSWHETTPDPLLDSRRKWCSNTTIRSVKVASSCCRW